MVLGEGGRAPVFGPMWDSPYSRPAILLLLPGGGGAPGFGLGTVSTGALGAHAGLGHRIFGAAATPIWHGARHLHHLGAAPAAIWAGVRPALASLLRRFRRR